MKKVWLLLVVILGIPLVACASAQPVKTANPGIAIAKSLSTPTVALTGPQSDPSAQPVSNTMDLVRNDDQGAVAFTVQPLNLDAPGATLDFEVSMNTHSVDLSMDLATRSTLSTNTGNSVSGSGWTGQSGGHHVSGTLSFPSSSNGKSILGGATKLVLTIIDVDAPERTFTWELSK